MSEQLTLQNDIGILLFDPSKARLTSASFKSSPDLNLIIEDLIRPAPERVVKKPEWAFFDKGGKWVDEPNFLNAEYRYTEDAGNHLHFTTKDDISLSNYGKNEFQVKVIVSYSLYSASKHNNTSGLSTLSYDKRVIFQNKGDTTWDENFGFLMPWLILRLKTGNDIYAVLPTNGSFLDYKLGTSGDGSLFNDSYVKTEGGISVRADGNHRAKIGATRNMFLDNNKSNGYLASIDINNQLLTIVNIDLKDGDYIDTRVDAPSVFGGAATEIYTGMENEQFIELEGHCPAQKVEPRSTISLTIHVSHHKTNQNGNLDSLYEILKEQQESFSIKIITNN